MSSAMTGASRGVLRALTHQALALGRRRGNGVALLHVRIAPADDERRARWLRTGTDAGPLVMGVLASLLRESDALAALGPNEFGLLLTEVWEEEGAARVACRLLEALTAPLRSPHDRPLDLRVAVGVALSPADGATHERLLRVARAASLRAEAEQTGFEFAAPHTTEEIRHRLNLEVDLGIAPATGQFELRYQPVVRLSSRSVAGVEALTYWPHRDRGVVPPGEFIPLAEQTGRILSLDRWALGSAVQNARSCFPTTAGGWISVNFSSRTLHHPDIVRHVEETLGRHNLPAGRLVVEVTESAAMRDVQASVRALSALRRLGVRVAVDDFGSGHSSLTYLRQLPLDILKLDRSFAHEVGRNGPSERLIESMVGLTRSLGLDMIVEGVETPAQLEWLAGVGCDMIQGFLFSRPIPLADVCLFRAPAAGDHQAQSVLAI